MLSAARTVTKRRLFPGHVTLWTPPAGAEPALFQRTCCVACTADASRPTVIVFCARRNSEGDTDSERQTETAREGGRQRDRQTETAREREGDRRTDREKETESELTYKNQVLVVHFGGKFSYYQLTLILIEGLV